MPERERPQKRPRSRRRHHPKRQHRTRRPSTQTVGVVDAAAAHQHRRHQSQHLATRPRARLAPVKAHRVIDQRLQTQSRHHRARQQQPRIGHQRPIVEHRLYRVDPTCYAAHRKCLLSWPESLSLSTAFSHVRRPFWWTRHTQKPHHAGGSRLSDRQATAGTGEGLSTVAAQAKQSRAGGRDGASLLRLGKPWVRGIAAGLLLAASLPPWGFWPLGLVGMALWVELLAEASPWRRAGLSALVSISWLGPATVWMADLTLVGWPLAVASSRSCTRWPARSCRPTIGAGRPFPRRSPWPSC